MIDEKKLVSDIKEYFKKHIDDETMDVDDVLNVNKDICGIIKSQPNVAVTDTNVGCKWIPCSERMPPIDKRVLVTVDIQGDLAIDIADHSYGLWFFADEYYSYTEKDFKVLAWMPLPAPWEGDADESN